MEGSATALAFQPVLREEQIYWQTKLDFHQFKKKETPFQCLCKAECLENGGWGFFCYAQLGLNMTGNSGIWAGVVKVAMEIHDVMLDRACQDS